MMSKKIFTARKRASLTQQQVADHLGLSRSAITKWESDNPNQHTAPERDQLVKFAELVRTPVGFFLDEKLAETDIPPPMGPPVAPKARPDKPSLAFEYRTFWDEVIARLPASVRSKALVQPTVPDWQRPIAPDLISARTAVRIITHPRPYAYMFAHDLSALVAYERSQSACLRLAAMFHLPDQVSGDLRTRFDEMHPRVQTLADHLKVTYIQVGDVPEAVQYLGQIL